MSESQSQSDAIESTRRWYRGDFHAHTDSSDGHHTPPELAQVGRAEGLDFFAITDHNSIEAFPRLDQDPGILIMHGIEVTLSDGHFNVLGADRWLDWMEHVCVGKLKLEQLVGKYKTPSELMRRTAEQGLLNSINHPLLQPWEWRDRATELSNLHCLEIWNDPSWPDNARDNPRAVALWTDLLNAGYRITAIGGSDYHRPAPRPTDPPKPPDRLGSPSTYVHAVELSTPAILDALRQHRAIVSMGARVDFHARVDATVYGIGDEVSQVNAPIEFTAIILDGVSSARAQIIKNGNVIVEKILDASNARLQYGDSINPNHSDWYRFDVFDDEGQMLAITNPIFTGARREPAQKTWGDFVRG